MAKKPKMIRQPFSVIIDLIIWLMVISAANAAGMLLAAIFHH